MRFPRLIPLSSVLLLGATLHAQEAPELTKTANALTLRSIGPALAGGRIADVAVHPTQRGTWYAAVGSGGLWKATNAGVTFTPVFDDQVSY